MERDLPIHIYVNNSTKSKEYSGEKDKNESGLIINTKINNNITTVILNNISTEPIILNKIEIPIKSIALDAYSKVILNSEYPQNGVGFKELSNRWNDYTSYLYAALLGENDFFNCVVGFIYSHTSLNTIKLVNNKDFIDVFAVCDFVNYKFQPGDILELDRIFMGEGRNIYNLLHAYISEMKVINGDEIKTGNKNIEATNMNIFYSNKATQNTLKSNAQITANVDGKKMYLMDIRKKESQKIIIDKIKNCENNVVAINNIKIYIEKVKSHKLFNVYQEMAKLLGLIKKGIENKILMFDDCPYGLAASFMDIINVGIPAHKFFANKLNYAFVFNTILFCKLFRYNLIASTKNNKIYKVLDEIVSGTLTDNTRPIYASVKNEEVFSILKYTDNGAYIAAFNMTKKEYNLFCDFSIGTNLSDINCKGHEIYTDEDYIISKGQIYIKHIKPNDCYLINCAIINEMKDKAVV